MSHRNVRCKVEIEMRVPDVRSRADEATDSSPPGFAAYLAGQLDDESHERVVGIVHDKLWSRP